MAGEFRRSWENARRHGLPYHTWYDALDLNRYQANQVVSGRHAPTPDELDKLTHRRRSTLVRYRDAQGGYHGFYTGRNMSLDELISSGALEKIAVKQADEADYPEPEVFTELREKYPSQPHKVKIYRVNRV